MVLSSNSWAATKSFVEGAAKTVYHGAVGIVHLFGDIAESMAQSDQARADIATGNYKDLARVQQESIKLGEKMYGPIAKGLQMMHLLYRDTKTRQIFENRCKPKYWRL